MLKILPIILFLYSGKLCLLCFGTTTATRDGLCYRVEFHAVSILPYTEAYANLGVINLLYLKHVKTLATINTYQFSVGILSME